MLTHIHSKQFKLHLYGEKQKVNFYRVNGEVQQIKTIHNILLVDLSLSMTYEIYQMKEELKKLLKKLNGYVSIICYSGDKESYVLFKTVKCDETSYNMNQVYDKIDSMDTIGLTVMSEPLTESVKIQYELDNIVDLTNVILFTDGCIVTYDVQSEKRNCLKIASLLNLKNCIISTIGFGQYYDKAFMNKLSSKGYHCHIDNIEDYNNVVSKIIQNSKHINGLNLSCNTLALNLSTGEYGESVKAYPSNVVAVVNSELISENTDLSEDIPVEIDSMYYILAKKHLIEEDINGFESIIKTLIGDLHLYKNIKDAYSFVEQGLALEKVNQMILNVDERFKEGRKFIIDDDDKSLSVLDVICEIMNDEKSKLFWNRKDKYKRTGIKNENANNELRFIINEDKDLFDIVDCSISSEKLNVSVLVKYDGKANNGSISRNCNMPRSYNIINNGNLNTRYIYAKLSESTYKSLIDNRIKVTLFNDSVYKIDLKGLKTANKRIALDMKKDSLIEILIRLKENKCKQKILNKQIKELLDGESKLNYCSNLSDVDKEICKALNIDENNNFRMETKKSEDKFEVYPAIFMTWDVKVNTKDIESKFKKELEESDVNNLNKEYQLKVLETIKKQIKADIRKDMFTINSVRIANAMVGVPIMIFDSLEEKNKTLNDKIMEQNMVIDGKVSVSTKIFDNTIFTQKKWLQLLKCS